MWWGVLDAANEQDWQQALSFERSSEGALLTVRFDDSVLFEREIGLAGVRRVDTNRLSAATDRSTGNAQRLGPYSLTAHGWHLRRGCVASEPAVQLPLRWLWHDHACSSRPACDRFLPLSPPGDRAALATTVAGAPAVGDAAGRGAS